MNIMSIVHKVQIHRVSDDEIMYESFQLDFWKINMNNRNPNFK